MPTLFQDKSFDKKANWAFDFWCVDKEKFWSWLCLWLLRKAHTLAFIGGWTASHITQIIFKNWV